MLWHDSDPKTLLVAKIARAVDYYTDKYNEVPHVVLVHPSMLGETAPVINGLSIRGDRSILPHHFLVGNDQNDPEKASVRGKNTDSDTYAQ